MMSYKTILVHCDAGRSVAARLDKAVALAEQHQAHLIGLHARSPFEPPVYDGSLGMDMFYKGHETAVAASEADAWQAFAKAIKGRSISSQWRSVDGYADASLTLHARY